MERPSKDVMQIISSHAENEYPKEAIGYIVENSVFKCENISPLPEKGFQFDEESIIQIGQLIHEGFRPIIYHSHTDDSRWFSSCDIKSCKAWELPFLLLTYPQGFSLCVDPIEELPYEGRDFVYGILDCYSLLRDYFKREYGIILDDFDRGEYNEWLNEGWNRFQENLDSQNFVLLEEGVAYRTSDAILFQYPNVPNPAHVGVFCDIEKNQFLHQLENTVSRKSFYGTNYKKMTVGVYRHRSLM